MLNFKNILAKIQFSALLFWKLSSDMMGFGCSHSHPAALHRPIVKLRPIDMQSNIAVSIYFSYGFFVFVSPFRPPLTVCLSEYLTPAIFCFPYFYFSQCNHLSAYLQMNENKPLGFFNVKTFRPFSILKLFTKCLKKLNTKAYF